MSQLRSLESRPNKEDQKLKTYHREKDGQL